MESALRRTSFATLRSAFLLAVLSVSLSVCTQPWPLATGENPPGDEEPPPGGEEPPPPPSIDEPVFTQGNSLIFYDGFEEYGDAQDLLTWQAIHPGRWAVVPGTESDINLATSGAAAGQKAVRFRYPASTAQQDRLIEATRTGSSLDPSVVVLTWQMRTKAGYVWYSGSGVGGQGHKIFLTNLSGSPDGNRLMMQFASDDMEPELRACYPEASGRVAPSWSIGSGHLVQNRNWPAFRIDGVANDGGWHRYTVRIQKSTSRPSLTRGNGRLEMWVDGVKVTEYIGDDPSRCEYGLVSIPTVQLAKDLHFPSVNGSANVDQWMEYDEVRIWTP